MRSLLTTPLVVLILFVPRTRASAQDSLPPLVPRTRVRVWSSEPSLSKQVANVVSMTDDTLWLQLAAQQLAVPTATISRLEVSRSRGAPTVGGFAGATFGFIVGAIVAQVELDRQHAARRCPDGICTGTAYATALGTVLAGIIGGRVIGHHLLRERWQAVRLPLHCARDSLATPPNAAFAKCERGDE